MCTYRHKSIVFGSADGKKQHHETKILFVPHFHKLTDATKKKKKKCTYMHACIRERAHTHAHTYTQIHTILQTCFPFLIMPCHQDT